MLILAKHTEINSALQPTHLKVYDICKALQQLKKAPKNQKRNYKFHHHQQARKLDFSREKKAIRAMFHYKYIF